MDSVDNGRPRHSSPPVKSVVSFNNHVRVLHIMRSKKAFLHPSSSYVVVTYLASTKIGYCHIPLFSISADVRRPSATGPEHRRDGKWRGRGAGVFAGWGGGERGWFPIRRGQTYWERGAPVTQAGPRHVLNFNMTKQRSTAPHYTHWACESITADSYNTHLSLRLGDRMANCQEYGVACDCTPTIRNWVS